MACLGMLGGSQTLYFKNDLARFPLLVVVILGNFAPNHEAYHGVVRNFFSA